MRIAICDDEQRFIDDFRRVTDKLYAGLDIVVDAFSDGNELLRSFEYRAYELVFLDIEMPGMDGLTLAERLRGMSEKVAIVFLTGHIEYAIKGYEVNALRYLTKPADEGKIRDVIDRVMKTISESKHLWIKTDMGEIKLMLEDILFIESHNQNVVFNTASDSFSVRGNMNDYEKQLEPDGFYRIHRGYLVALAKIRRISGREVVMEDGTILPVSRNRESGLREVLFSYVSREAF